jgi:hypothetical protein
MSTLVYAGLTRRRKEAPRRTSKDESPPGVKTYVDALTALVPAEVLGLHALALALFTQTRDDGRNQTVWTITERGSLQIAFFVMIAVAIILYVTAARDVWENMDYLRVCIPPLAFVGWTMIQDNTAFDGLVDWHSQLRFFIPAAAAVALGTLAAGLARKADEDPPHRRRTSAPPGEPPR